MIKAKMSVEKVREKLVKVHKKPESGNFIPDNGHRNCLY